jgi:hypothetical protein
MDTLIPKGLQHMRFAVVDGQDYCISLHQHPDAADRLISVSARDDLRTVMLPELPGHEINFEEAKPF